MVPSTSSPSVALQASCFNVLVFEDDFSGKKKQGNNYCGNVTCEVALLLFFSTGGVNKPELKPASRFTEVCLSKMVKIMN